MASYQDRLNKIKTAYHECDDPDLLQGELAQLKEVLSFPNLYEEYKVSGAALLLRLQSKYYLLAFAQDFGEDVFQKGSVYMEDALREAKEKNFAKTEAAVGHFLSLMKTLHAVVNGSGVFGLAERMRSATDGQAVGAALSAVAKAREALERASLPDLPDVALGDPRGRAAEYLAASERSLKETERRIVARTVGGFLEDITPWQMNEYFPKPECSEGGKANALVVSTPFKEDARLFAAYLTRQEGSALYLVSANKIKGKKDLYPLLLRYAKERGGGCIFEDASVLQEAELDALLSCAMLACKEKAEKPFRVFFTDGSGKAELYARAMQIAAEQDGFSVLDASLEYVSVPPFGNAAEELRERGAENAEETLKSMPFLGFYGFNMLISHLAVGDRLWKQKGKHISDGNAHAANAYLSRLSDPYLLIDAGWGDFSLGSVQGGVKLEFNYDDIGGVDAENVKRIIESGETVFAKCGMLARYCTIGSNDYSVWQRMEREEMARRLYLAVKMVYQVMGIAVTDTFPQVEILDELSEPTAGGLCCDGGKVIRFKAKCTMDFTWLADCIVHECFHSMQSMLTNGGWTPWYFDNFGITRGRVQSWKATRAIYNSDTNSDVYKVHMYEGDARAFEADCREARDKAWGNIKFE